MRFAIKCIFFTYISVLVAQNVLGAVKFESPSNQNLYLFVFALSALYFFSRPLLKILTLPHHGPGYVFMNFIMTLILLYALNTFVPILTLVPTNLSNLIIFGFMLPSKSLTAFWSGVVESLLIAVVYTFFDWLCPRNRK